MSVYDDSDSKNKNFWRNYCTGSLYYCVSYVLICAGMYCTGYCILTLQASKTLIGTVLSCTVCVQCPSQVLLINYFAIFIYQPSRALFIVFCFLFLSHADRNNNVRIPLFLNASKRVKGLKTQ